MNKKPSRFVSVIKKTPFTLAKLFTNPWVWVILFIIIFVLVNWLLFHSYQQELLHQQLLHPETGPVGNVWAQIWGYCGTDAFKTVTISLVIPIILAALGGIFKLKDAVGERIRKTQDERTKERWKCVEQTAKLWNDVYCLTSEVRFFKVEKEPDADKEEARIEALKTIIQKAENLANSGEDTISEWRFRFPNLIDDARLLLEPMNILLNSSSTIAYRILKEQENKNKKEIQKIKDLQNSLGVIQDVTKMLAHQSTLTILKCSVDIKRHDLTKKEIKDAKSEIKRRIERLEKFSDLLKIVEEKYNELLPTIVEKELENVAAFREAVKKAKEWPRKYCKSEKESPEKCLERFKESFEVSQEFQNFEGSFRKIDVGEFALAWEIDCSKEYLNNLARRLGFEYFHQNLEQNIEGDIRQKIKEAEEPPKKKMKIWQSCSEPEDAAEPPEKQSSSSDSANPPTPS